VCSSDLQVREALAVSGLDPCWLDLEITESVIMQEPERVVDLLGQLKALGVHLSIDDFGTGYSSLAYLKRFPLDKIKIDRSFVTDLETDANDAAIVRMVIGIAKELELKVIAEGVETDGQRDFLHQHHCDQIQGFYLSQPVPAESIPGTIAAFPPTPH
jgi:EAL domain-containing protein (putative c-di-GMP-specific phosphodiesterase class I)